MTETAHLLLCLLLWQRQTHRRWPRAEEAFSRSIPTVSQAKGWNIEQWAVFRIVPVAVEVIGLVGLVRDEELPQPLYLRWVCHAASKSPLLVPRYGHTMQLAKS